MLTSFLAVSLALADGVAAQDPCMEKPCPEGHEPIDCPVDSAECDALRKQGYAELCRGYIRDRYCLPPAPGAARDDATATAAPPTGCGCDTSVWSPAAGVVLLLGAMIRRRTA